MMHSQQHKPDPARPPTAEVGTAQTARHTPAATPPALAARPLLFGLAPVGAAEHEADERAEQRRRLPEAAPRDAGWVNPPPLLGLASPNGTGLRIQRKALDAEVDDGVEATPAAGLIVDDDVTEALGPGQLHKSEFLNQLEREVCRTAEQALSGTIWSAAGCPWIAHWFGYYHNRSASQIERAIRKYAPEAANSTSAQALIPIICARVERSIRVWTDTGEVTGVPEGIALDLPASGLMGIVGGAVSSIASGVSSVVSGVASVGASIAGGIGSAVSSLGSLFFKRQAGAAEMSANPHAVQGQLGSGQALDGGLQARMGSAFGVNLGLVRVHTDAGAATLARQFNARAFTVGQHIAFGSGEYRPGTPIGDALIAHELAHVLQQSAVHPMGGSDTVALEEDANRSALDVVASLWGGLNDTHVHGLPRLRSGLGLQRCKSEHQKEVERLAGLQRSFLEEQARKKELARLEAERQKKIDELKKKGDPNPNVPPVDESKITITDDKLKDVVDQTVNKSTRPKQSTDPWLVDRTEAQRNAYISHAQDVIKKVVTTANGSPEYADIATLLKKIPPKFDNDTAIAGLKDNNYAWVTGSNFAVSIDWIDDADKDARNVFANIAHEVGGHREYDDPALSDEVADEVLKQLPAEVRKKYTGTKEARQNYYETYAYKDTELFAELRERRYAVPDASGFTATYQGDKPDDDIPKLIGEIRDNWHPEVARLILTNVVKKARSHPYIRKEDLEFLQAKIKEKMGYEIK